MSASLVFSSVARGRPFILSAKKTAELLAQVGAIPKLAAVVGRGEGARQKEKEDKHGRQSAERDNAMEQERSALMAPPVVPRLAENRARAEANAFDVGFNDGCFTLG